jgi:hypothetical protein
VIPIGLWCRLPQRIEAAGTRPRGDQLPFNLPTQNKLRGSPTDQHSMLTSARPHRNFILGRLTEFYRW